MPPSRAVSISGSQYFRINDVGQDFVLSCSACWQACLMIASTTTGGGSSTRRRRNSSTAAIAQNVNIGAACVAFFPTTSQTATIGTIGTALSGIFFGGSFCYTGAPAAALPLFDGGRRRGDLDYARASRDVAGSGSKSRRKSRRKPRALASRRPRPACRTHSSAPAWTSF